ncbi:hypothetical protein PV797_04215 [Clostridiaceae bacterium M8S5]|nr:hypothetical protein PV797_04215 [Clostridiaceae bacterium M8S5]
MKKITKKYRRNTVVAFKPYCNHCVCNCGYEWRNDSSQLTNHTILQKELDPYLP